VSTVLAKKTPSNPQSVTRISTHTSSSLGEVERLLRLEILPLVRDTLADHSSAWARHRCAAVEAGHATYDGDHEHVSGNLDCLAGYVNDALRALAEARADASEAEPRP
jgi:hypothetical protein